MMIKPLNVLGLMSGTSLEGIKVALISTDGIDVYECVETHNIPYPDTLREKIRAILGKNALNPQDKELIDEVEVQTSDFMVDIIEDIKKNSETPIDIIGVEGPTIGHDVQKLYTYQLGKGRYIAEKTGIKVITHFHNADMLNGGQGSPITASYYDSLARNLSKPIAFVNIGGTTNITWIGHYGEIVAFDCGPGNGLIDDWVLKHAGVHMDFNGKFAATGHVQEKIVAQMMKHDFIAKYPPKSVDRNAFNDKVEHLEGLSVEDGAATVTEFVAEAIAYSLAFYLPEVPSQVVLCGGGIKNPTLVRFIRHRLKDMDIQISLKEDLGFDISDAQAIAFLAARRLYSLPITFPTTTGIAQPMTGGEIYEKE